ncbi:ankyrin repeat-containing protein [Neophaeococcomyces mojaviensis]|uniref:Ankyrin repeat-containing protein n=1 Tax=Neophaeococcomyces mojaviensis TaxID=3383035 RepID=A0ACC3AG91_9EURO|nr:ankyrin repeat-containing protein [Knufia sp. JES_112]
MSTTTDTTTSRLTADDIDDLIYACRTGNLEWLSELVTAWSAQLSISESQVITSAIDIDDEGLGSRSCLLHYPAANGNLEIMTYLLDRISTSPPSAVSANDAQTNGTSTTSKTEEEHRRFVNTQNVNGNTPLHWAALNGHIEVVKALVKAGADPTIVNEAGRDAVVEAEYSSKESAAECANWLLKECEILERGTGSQIQEGQADADAGEESMDVERATDGAH